MQATPAARPLRIARLRAPFSGTPVDPESERTADLAEDVCRRLGHTVAEAKPKEEPKKEEPKKAEAPVLCM